MTRELERLLSRDFLARKRLIIKEIIPASRCYEKMPVSRLAKKVNATEDEVLDVLEDIILRNEIENIIISSYDLVFKGEPIINITGDESETIEKPGTSMDSEPIALTIEKHPEPSGQEIDVGAISKDHSVEEKGLNEKEVLSRFKEEIIDYLNRKGRVKFKSLEKDLGVDIEIPIDVIEDFIFELIAEGSIEGHIEENMFISERFDLEDRKHELLSLLSKKDETTFDEIRKELDVGNSNKEIKDFITRQIEMNKIKGIVKKDMFILERNSIDDVRNKVIELLKNSTEISFKEIRRRLLLNETVDEIEDYVYNLIKQGKIEGYIFNGGFKKDLDDDDDDEGKNSLDVNDDGK
ncbi:MAG: PCI domain-containing protein [Promethearchaeota archaeon]